MAPWLSNSVRFLCVATLMAGLASRNCLAKQDIDMTQTESGLVTRLADVDAFEACVPANVMCLREEYGRENQGWWSSGAQTRQRVPRRALVFLAVYRSRKCVHSHMADSSHSPVAHARFCAYATSFKLLESLKKLKLCGVVLAKHSDTKVMHAT